MEDYGMKQEHGGGDDIEYDDEAVEKPIKLDKYLHASDFNITDIFERIVKAYQRGEDPKKLLEKIKYERMSLMRAGIRAMQRGLIHLKISKKMIAFYLARIILDQDWKIVFNNLIRESYDGKTKHPLCLVVGMNKSYSKYKEKFTLWISDLVVDLNNEEVLSLVHEMHNKELVASLKKHLILIARDDVGKNKDNAINALVNIAKDDPDIIRLLALILKRPDEEAHGFVLYALLTKGKVKNPRLIEEITKLDSRTKNPHIKNLIKRLLG